MDTGTIIGIIVAIVAALGAIVAAIYTGWQGAIAKETYELTRQIHEDQNQPYVYADIRSDEDQPELIVLVLRNSGPTVATDVRVTFDPPIPVDPARNVPPLAELEVSAVPPGAKFRRALGVGHSYFQSTADQISVTVTAKGPSGKTEPLRYDLDLAALRLTAIGGKSLYHVVGAIETLSKHTEVIAQTILRRDGSDRA